LLVGTLSFSSYSFILSLSHHVTKGMEISFSMSFPITNFNFVCFASIGLFVNYSASSASCNSMKKRDEEGKEEK
jgi:hypothetical protein